MKSDYYRVSSTKANDIREQYYRCRRHVVNESIDTHTHYVCRTRAAIPPIPLSDPSLSIPVPSANMYTGIWYIPSPCARAWTNIIIRVGTRRNINVTRRGRPEQRCNRAFPHHHIWSGVRSSSTVGRSLPCRDTTDRTLSIIIARYPPSNFLPPFSLPVAFVCRS